LTATISIGKNAEHQIGQDGLGVPSRLPQTFGGLRCAMPDVQFLRDSSNRLNFQVSRCPASSYQALCVAVATTFQLSPSNPLITNGCDIAFQDYRGGERLVSMEWDNWCGFTVVAKTENSETLVREIGAWILQSIWASIQ
jgi:hypothetical protein